MSLLSGGQAILDSLKNAYFPQRKTLNFDITSFLKPYISKIRDWIARVERSLEEGFKSTVHMVDFKNAPVSAVYTDGTHIQWGGLVNQLESKIAALSRILKQADPAVLKPIKDPSSVFLVHGRSENWNKRVEDFLKSIPINPVILEDQPNMGQTLIEKFETHADVGFAIV